MSGTYILIPDYKTTVSHSAPIDLVTEQWEADRSWAVGERNRSTRVTTFYHRSYPTFGAACRSRDLNPKEVRRRKIVETPELAPMPAVGFVQVRTFDHSTPEAVIADHLSQGRFYIVQDVFGDEVEPSIYTVFPDAAAALNEVRRQDSLFQSGTWRTDDIECRLIDRTSGRTVGTLSVRLGEETALLPQWALARGEQSLEELAAAEVPHLASRTRMKL